MVLLVLILAKLIVAIGTDLPVCAAKILSLRPFDYFKRMSELMIHVRIAYQ